MADEDWLCACCGFGCPSVSAECAALEEELQTMQTETETALALGAPLRARRLLCLLIENFAPRLHPQHAVLFNAHTLLAGLLASHPSRNVPQARRKDRPLRRRRRRGLCLWRRAGISASLVFLAVPGAHLLETRHRGGRGRASSLRPHQDSPVPQTGRPHLSGPCVLEPTARDRTPSRQ